MDLQNKVAVITGAGQGIGRAIALTFAKEGADIVIPDVNLDRANSVAEEVRAMGRRALALKVDCCESSEIERLFDTVQQEFHRLDILVNNAVSSSKGHRIIETTEEDWEASIRGVLKGYFLCTQRAAKDMIKQGTGGKIISISSVAALVALGPKGSLYAIAKAGVLAMTHNAALEFAPYRITVNAICPGFIDTPLAYKVLQEYERKARLDNIPLGRYGQPADIAGAAFFLACPYSDWFTGQALIVDGGWSTSFMIREPGS